MDFIIVPFVNVLLFIYQTLGAGGNAFGWAIIIFTILIRLLMYPLTKQQLDSSKKMTDLTSSPEYIQMQKKYKDDKEKLAQEQMKLYQEKGISPFGSCLPTLIQFPLIIGLYWSVTKGLATSPLQLLGLIPDISLADAANLIPINSQFLWMDLSQPERWLGLSNLIPSSFPIIGEGIPIMAIIVFISSYYQSKVMTPPSSNPNDQTAAMGKMMVIYMPLLMAWLSYSYSAGLALYFVASNLVSLIQYALMGRLNLPSFGKKSEAKK